MTIKEKKRNAMRRERLRSALMALAELDKCVPADTMLDQSMAVESAMESLKDNFSDYVGKCEECDAILLEGDMGHRCVDGEPLFCAEHAYTWSDVKESYEVEDGVRDDDPDAYRDFVQRFEAHIAAGGKPDDKIVWPL